MNYLVISAIKDGKEVYLATDQQSGGYPYWANSISSANSYSVDKSMDNVIDNIKKNFSSRTGVYFDSNIHSSSLKILKMGVISETTIDIQEPTTDMKAADLIARLKSTLSADELKIIGTDNFHKMAEQQA